MIEHIEESSPIRQATIRRQKLQTPEEEFEEDPDFGSDSESFKSNDKPAKVRKGGNLVKNDQKHYKVLDPKKDKFSKQNFNQMIKEKSARIDKLQRALSYNKQTELLHLDERAEIKAMPLDKHKFGIALDRFNNGVIQEEEELVNKQIESELNEKKTRRFEVMFA